MSRSMQIFLWCISGALLAVLIGLAVTGYEIG